MEGARGKSEQSLEETRAAPESTAEWGGGQWEGGWGGGGKSLGVAEKSSDGWQWCALPRSPAWPKKDEIKDSTATTYGTSDESHKSERKP